MGLFDTIHLEIECPYCGKTEERGAQTKDLECCLLDYKVGDFVTDKLKYLECAASYRNEHCEKIAVENIGYTSGFGRVFDLGIFLDNDGKITDKYEIIEDE